MVINLRQNTNDDSTAFGKWFAEVDAKEPLNLKGLAKHMTEHGKISSEEMCNLVLGEMVKCLIHLVREGQPVKLDGFGTFSPSVDGQGNGKNDIETAVAGVVQSVIRTVGGKQKRFQNKTPISYVLAPEADGNGGGGNG